jgi:rare lipoprotein A
MTSGIRKTVLLASIGIGLSLGATGASVAHEPTQKTQAQTQKERQAQGKKTAGKATAKYDHPQSRHAPDRSGKRQVGEASYYAPMFHGRTMANGKPMRPNDDNAASKTLPLGTKAKVTNLETGRSTVVTIEDRGPYVAGRIIDLSPGSAREIGLTPRQGVAPVEVVPIQVPLPDGRVAMGEAPRDAQ